MSLQNDVNDVSAEGSQRHFGEYYDIVHSRRQVSVMSFEACLNH